MENSDDDDFKIACIGPATLSDSEFQSPDDRSKFTSVMTHSTKNINLSLLCRLCAKPNEEMTNIFDIDAVGKDIPSMIHLCLPVMVKKTDTLPIQVCRPCLEELERCYRFHQTVAEADEQLLAFERLSSGNLEEINQTLKTFTQCDRVEDEPLEHDSVGETLEITYELEMGNDVSTCSLKQSQSNFKHHNRNSTTEAIDLASGIVQQATCDSKVTKSTSCGSAVNKIQGNEAKRVRIKQVDKAVERSSHTGRRHYRCSTCARMFTEKRYLIRHIKIHASVRKLYRCDTCSRTFLSKHGLSEHLKSHSGPRKRYTCDLCSKMFLSKLGLSGHLKSHYGPRELYTCDLCSKMFLSKLGLSRHLKSHSGPRIVHKCGLCSKMLASKQILSLHVKSHSDPRELYRCDLCSKTFVSKVGLSGHLKSHSGPRKHHRCDLCSRVYQSKSGLYHHRKFHTGDGLYSCNYCGKQFARKAERNRHNIVHTGERPFKCSKCEKTFTRSEGLRKHTARVHSDR